MSKFVYVAYRYNADHTEGRGYDIPIAVCEIEATAIRLAKGRYIQGSNGPVRKVELVEVDGKFFCPDSAVSIIKPNSQDIEAQVKMDAKTAAIEKALAAGLTEDEISALKS